MKVFHILRSQSNESYTNKNSFFFFKKFFLESLIFISEIRKIIFMYNFIFVSLNVSYIKSYNNIYQGLQTT